MSYVINGPTQIGDTGSLNEILGDVRLTNVTSALGDILYADATNNLTALPIGADGTVLTVVAGVPAWSGFTTTETGFSARKTGTQGPIAAPFSDTTITTWSTSTAPEFDTTGGDFNATTGVYTASSAGTVNARAGVSMSSTVNSGTRSASILYNSTADFVATAQPSASNAIPLFFSLSTNLNLAISDTVEVAVSSDAATGSSTVLATPQTWFSISKNFTP